MRCHSAEKQASNSNATQQAWTGASSITKSISNYEEQQDERGQKKTKQGMWLHGVRVYGIALWSMLNSSCLINAG